MNRERVFKHFVSFVVLCFLIFLAVGSTDNGGEGSSSSSSSSSSSTIHLNAGVTFSGTQFIIQNNDSFDWTNVKLEVNSKTFSSGYILKSGRIAAGETYTVGAMQFANSDGEKFNPFSHKPLNFSIWCDTAKGKGLYYGSWE